MNADIKINNTPLKSPTKMLLEMQKRIILFQNSLDFRNFFEKTFFEKWAYQA